MKIGIRKFTEIARELKLNYPKLTEYEILTLAIQLERNEILENGLVVSSNDNVPSGIEAIAISLGFTGGDSQRTITNVLAEMGQKE